MSDKIHIEVFNLQSQPVGVFPAVGGAIPRRGDRLLLEGQGGRQTVYVVASVQWVETDGGLVPQLRVHRGIC